MKESNREIRVFISSTFNDMQQERDALVKTFKYLKTEAEKRNVNIVMIDLRWGITESESARGKVIDICLKEINKSKPFFIGIIGDNYGSVPPTSLSHNVEILKDYPDVALDIQNGKSYTEIEMQYGVLGNSEKLDAFFYIKRNSKDQRKEANEKLENLKRKINSQKRYPVYPYSSANDIANQVREDFLKVLDERFPEKDCTLEDRIKQRQFDYYCSLTDFYIENQSITGQVSSLIDSDSSKKIIHINGDSGSGKTSLCARIIQLYSSKENYDVLYYFAGLGGADEGITDVVSFLLKKPVGFNDAENAISDKAMYSPIKKIIVLDGLDAFNQEVINQYGFMWLSLLPANYTVIISATSGTKLDSSLSSRLDSSMITCAPLDSVEKTEFALQYLERIGKKLERAQMDTIINSSLTDSPAVLRCFLDELSAFGYYEKLDERIRFYISKQTPVDFYESVLSRLENDFGEAVVKPVFQHLALSREGLSEDEIVELCEIKRIDLSLLLCNCPSLINVINGYARITNNQTRLLICQSAQECGDAIKVRRRIADYYIERCRNYNISFLQYNPLKKVFLYDGISRIIHEVAYQLLELKDYSALYDALIKPSFFEVLFRTDRTLLATAWRVLESEGYAFESMLGRNELRFLDPFLAPVVFTDLGRFSMDEMENSELARRFYENCTNIMSTTISRPTQMKVKAANLTNLAIAAYRAGKYEEALSFFEESLAVTLTIPGFGRDSEEYASGYANLARMHKKLEHYDEAIKYFKEARDSYERIHKGVHQDTADVIEAMAYCYYQSNDDKTAYDLYRQAYEYFCALVGNDSEDAIMAQYGMGRSLVYLNDCANAVEVLNEALDKSIRVRGEEDESTRDIYDILGYCWERIYKILDGEVAKEESKNHLLQAAICYAHADQKDEAQRILNIYNTM